jgi:hypothetical protein
MSTTLADLRGVSPEMEVIISSGAQCCPKCPSYPCAAAAAAASSMLWQAPA